MMLIKVLVWSAFLVASFAGGYYFGTHNEDPPALCKAAVSKCQQERSQARFEFFKCMGVLDRIEAGK